jgi:hypothetical protein
VLTELITKLIEKAKPVLEKKKKIDKNFTKWKNQVINDENLPKEIA